MHALQKPNVGADEIVDSFSRGIRDKDLKERIISTKAFLRGADKVFRIHAVFGVCASFKEEHGSSNACLLSDDELIKLYNQNLVKGGGKKLYKKIRSGAILSKCPYCGFNQVKTLDHYLPKRKFASLSLSPLNLVPSCRDCNTGKGEEFSGDALHPYFDAHLINRNRWLFARTTLLKGELTIKYFVSAPKDWAISDNNRLSNHFINLNLQERYSIEAASRLSELKNNLSDAFSDNGANGVKSELEKELNKYKEFNHSKYKDRYINSWEVAMLETLISCQWFCMRGFNRI